MTARRSVRTDCGGGISYVEVLVIAALAVAGGWTLTAVSTHVAGRFVEVDRVALARNEAPPFARSRANAASKANALKAGGAASLVGSALHLAGRLGWRALAIATVVPIPWEWVGLDSDELAAQERYRAPIVQAVAMTAVYLVPATVEMIGSVIADPSQAVDALSDPVGIARSIVTSSYEDAVDVVKFAFAESDAESAEAGARFGSGLIANVVFGRVLKHGRRRGGRGSIGKLDINNAAERKIWEEFVTSAPRRGQLLGWDWAELSRPGALTRELQRKKQFEEVTRYVYERDGKIRAAMQLIDGMDSLEIQIVGPFSAKAGRALLQDATVRSNRFGHNWRLRAVPTPETRDFFTRNGFVPMLDEFPMNSDLVLASAPARALRDGVWPVRGRLGEWTRLEEWQREHLQRATPDLHRDLTQILRPRQTIDEEYAIDFVAGHQRRHIDVEGRKVVFDPSMPPYERLQSLAFEIGEMRSNVPRVPPESYYREKFVDNAILERMDRRGDGIYYELQTRDRMIELTGRDVPSRYSYQMMRIYGTYRNVAHEARRRLGEKWATTNYGERGSFSAMWREELKEHWEAVLRFQQSTAVEEAEMFLGFRPRPPTPP